MDRSVDVVSIGSDGTASTADGRTWRLVMARDGALGLRPVAQEPSPPPSPFDQVGGDVLDEEAIMRGLDQ